MKVKQWYAAYTLSRMEKKTAKLLEKAGVEAYVPLQKTLRQWSDRKKWVEVPLINSYVFVKTDFTNYFDILSTHGVIKLVSFEGKPVPIPEYQVEALKSIISEKMDAEALNTNIPKGSPVQIVHGQLKGLGGELVRYKGKQKVVIKLDNINTSILLDIPANYVKKVK